MDDKPNDDDMLLFLLITVKVDPKGLAEEEEARLSL
jgi:hypothetical protein